MNCAAQVVVAAGDADLFFVGRSPSNLRDLLRGALQRTSWGDRLHALPLSIYGVDLEGEVPRDLSALYPHLRACGLSPRRLVRGRPVAFVDLVCSGGTFVSLHMILHRWCRAQGVASVAASANTHFVCIFNDEFAELDQPLSEDLAPAQLCPLRIGDQLWGYLADTQEKASRSYDLSRWGGPVAEPRPRAEHLRARRLGHALFELGASLKGRRRLLRRLRRACGSRPWLRGLVSELEAQCASRRGGRPARVLVA